ncbi:hypothetical protein BHE74_00032480 [Ensete ventricosum]|nr:hypothetical protein BHE74_00032480 [Ensete ventricosum]RZS12999.1 hypothetical protein BHM03_00044517 [Ensete ventricosum]
MRRNRTTTDSHELNFYFISVPSMRDARKRADKGLSGKRQGPARLRLVRHVHPATWPRRNCPGVARTTINCDGRRRDGSDVEPLLVPRAGGDSATCHVSTVGRVVRILSESDVSTAAMESSIEMNGGSVLARQLTRPLPHHDTRGLATPL